jgi:hypothetical protein
MKPGIPLGQRQIGTGTGGQIIHHDHRFTRLQQTVGQVRADEARTAGHDDGFAVHRCSLTGSRDNLKHSGAVLLSVL